VAKNKTKIELPYWQTQPCPPWCRGDHQDAEISCVERLHYSRFTGETVLTVMDPDVHDRGAGREPRFTYDPREVHVYLEQHVREAEPRVKLEEPAGTSRIDMDLTLAEAERIARHLLRAVRLARS
jgi:hypothetical protein